MNSPMDGKEIVSKMQEVLSNEIPFITYATYIAPLDFESMEGNHITFKCDSQYVKEPAETRYASLLLNALKYITNRDFTFSVHALDNDTQNIKEDSKIISSNNNDSDDEIDYSQQSLNPKYTFDTFVVGESNKLAYGTALAVAQNPGKLYNPYFIYAKSGLGKTHLMHAIGNYIVEHSDKKVLYITAEQFTNDYRAIINAKSKYDNNVSYLEAFRDKYRNVDVLMIDDIQFLENATKSQIEFTNTFNTLYDNEKQIIIASDTSINDYKYLEDRLKTRFRWGLTESINPPELELKKNIIKNKIMINNYDLDINEDVIDYIASNCGSDIRNLEGAVIRIVAYKAAFNIPEVTLSIAQDALQEFTGKVFYKTNSVGKIIDIVSKYYNLDSTILKGKMKKKNIADARNIAIYLSTMMTEESLERIGLEFGGRDHSTIIYARDKISQELKTNIKLKEEIKILKEKICE